jgi:predicted aldo/keto reductase-like oxidoreductase
MMEAQRIAKQQGKIRFAGISNHSGHKELLPFVAKRSTSMCC